MTAIRMKAYAVKAQALEGQQNFTGVLDLKMLPAETYILD